MTKLLACLVLTTASVVTLAPVPLRADVPATTQSLDSKLDSILNRLSNTGATVSVRVLDADSGKELYARDADRPSIPASNLKLVSSAVALDLFGPDHQLETRLGLVGADLYLIGSGDPATGDPKIAKKYGKTPTDLLDAWADELTAAGITRVDSIRFYEGAFDDRQACYAWELDDLMFWYAAPIGGLNFNDNCIDITATPAEKGKPAKLTLYPLLEPATDVINTSVTISEGDEDWDAGPFSTREVYWVKGTVLKERVENCPVTDPGKFFADVLKTRLKAKGIAVTGTVERVASVPAKFDREFTPIRTKFVDVLHRVNKNSQNLLAEGFSKLAGREFAKREGRDVPGSWAEGEKAAKAFFAKHNIDASAFVLDDGSGLSRKNRVTTHLLSDLLLAMHKHPDGEVFRNSMTIGGVDGTAAARFKDVPNRVFAKTGYIGGVRAYSGYVKTDSGKWIIFSIIYNNIPGRVKPYEELQDEAVRELMKR